MSMRSSSVSLVLALLVSLSCAWPVPRVHAQSKFPRYEAPPPEELPPEELPPEELPADEEVPQDEAQPFDDGAAQDTSETEDAAEAAEEPATTEPTEPTQEAADAAASDDAAAAEPPPNVRVYIAAGAGAGTLQLIRPVAEGSQKLPRSAFAAADMQLRVHAWPSDRLSFDFAFVYETSLGMRLQVEPLFGLSQTVAARAQRAELSAAPMLRLAEGPSALSLAFPVGLWLRSFVPDQHEYGLPRHLLVGLLVRAELLAPLGPSVRLRIGPELQWILSVGASLRNQGACCAGVALGGQGSLEADVTQTFRVALVYREARSFVPASDARFKDIERLLTARLGVEL